MSNATTNQDVLKTIINQLGGAGRLRAMVGVTQFIADGENKLCFQFKGSRKANRVHITLNSLDTYDVEFFKYNRKSFECPQVGGFENVYGDQLVEIFERFTGLYLSM